MSDSGTQTCDIGALADFPVGRVREIIADGHVLAVARIGDEVFALDGLCPHQGGPLGQGKLVGEVVICPWHQFSFEMRTGFCTSSRGLAQKRFEVRLEGDRVIVQIGGD
jgi:nitrite reductase (NADH) small subunit